MNDRAECPPLPAARRAWYRRLWPRTLTGKGAAALAVVGIYVMAAAMCIAVERGRLLNAVQQLERVHKHNEELVRADVALAEAALEVLVASYGAAEPLMSKNLAGHLERARLALERVSSTHPPARDWAHAIGAHVAAVTADPSKAGWLALRDVLRNVRGDLDAYRRVTYERAEALRDGLLSTYNVITYTWLVIALTGVVLVGVVIGSFFARLTRDVLLLERRAGEIVRGYRGAPLALDRDDEIEHLAQAVNRMAADLRERELRLELDQQHRAYEDKMAALGAFADGIAHEVNNPLTAISSVAQDLAAEGGKNAGVAEQANVILSQVRRAAVATRQLSNLATPQPSEYEWIDFNDLLHRTIGLMRYDRRYRHVVFEVQFAADLPAVRTVPARLQQALFDIIIATADALAASGGHLSLRTGRTPTGVECTLEDSRGGTEARVMSAALAADIGLLPDASPVVRAMMLARKVVESLKGKVVAEPDARGLTLRFQLPLETSATD